MSEIDKALRRSPFWLGAGMLLAFLTLWAIPGSGGEAVISREVILNMAKTSPTGSQSPSLR